MPLHSNQDKENIESYKGCNNPQRTKHMTWISKHDDEMKVGMITSGMCPYLPSLAKLLFIVTTCRLIAGYYFIHQNAQQV